MYTTVSALLTRLPALNDREAWAIFNERYTPVLRQFFKKYGITDDVRRDLAQDTIERTIEGLRRGDFDPQRGRLRDWIGGIARNVLRSHWRQQRGQANAGGGGAEPWEAREDPAASGDLAAFERRFDSIWVRARLSALIRAAASSFPRTDLRCYFLVEVHRLPVALVAERLGLGKASVFAKRRAVADWFLAVGPRFFVNWER